MQESSTAGQAELADGSAPFVGFQTRDSQVGGPVLGDVIYPGRLELPFVAGEEGTFEHGEEVSAEGTDFIDTTSQYGAISSGTALKSPLTFKAGKFSLALSGDLVFYMLVDKPTPEIAGNVRIRARAVAAYLKA